MSESNESNGNGKRERTEDEADSQPPIKTIKSENIEQPEQEQTHEPASNESPTIEHPQQSQEAETKNGSSELEKNEELTTSSGSSAPSSSKPPVNDPRKIATTSASSTPTTTNTQVANNNSNQIIEEKGEVSSLYVGRVIGKGGEMIRDLQARSGARIDVDQNVPAGHPRVITYKGTRQTVEFAKQLVAILSREGASESDLPLGHASMEQLVIPAQSVGKVIGRGGEMIRELQARSQAKIQIDHTGRSGHPADQKLVTITGTKESTAKAKEMVNFLVSNPMMDAQQSLNMLIEEKARSNMLWGTGPPYPNLPNQGIGMTPQMIQQGPHYSNGPGGGNLQQNLGGGPNHHMSNFGAPGMPNMFPPQMVLQGQEQMYGNGPSGTDVEVFYAARQYMGRIIGSKGITVNDLQRRSGCEIQINQDVPPGQDCEITLKGPRPGIESAKQMLRDIIETGPQHPYAGGADTYGGGPTNFNQQPHHQNSQTRGNPQMYGYQQNYDQNYQQPYSQPQQYAVPAFGHTSPPLSSYGNYPPPQQPIYPQQSANLIPQFQPQYPAPQPKIQPPMVSPWKAATSPDGQVYYYNERTGETQWERPMGMP